MREEIEAVLQEIAGRFADRRTQLDEAGIADLEGDTVTLTGRVLDETTHQVVLKALGRFPTLVLDDQLQVLRQRNPRIVRVATNLSSLHMQPSFLVEMATQMVYGASMELLEAQDRWGFVRLSDGYLGWTYLPYVSEAPLPVPTHWVTAGVSLLRAEAAHESALVSRVLGGTPLCVLQTVGEWAQVQANLTGWLPLADLRSMDALPMSPEARRAQMMQDAPRLMGVQYLWGGSTAHGIDCSGFAQLLHRWVGITLPRDADMQYAVGRPVEAPFQPGDLLFFGENGDDRSITHVGVSLGGWQMIHSSRARNGVYVDDVQSVPHLRDRFAGARTFVER